VGGMVVVWGGSFVVRGGSIVVRGWLDGSLGMARWWSSSGTK